MKRFRQFLAKMGLARIGKKSPLQIILFQMKKAWGEAMPFVDLGAKI